jgi:protein translocase SecG subunit
MQLLITFLTVVLVLNCLLLGLLVLIQLPKKEAGVGIAFGGGTTDALFGAGSGNALTKLTKYSSATFLLLSLFLGVMNSRAHRANESEVRKALANSRPATTTPVAAPAKPASQFQTLPTNGTSLITKVPAATPTTAAPLVISTNAPAIPAATTTTTNAATPK